MKRINLKMRLALRILVVLAVGFFLANIDGGLVAFSQPISEIQFSSLVGYMDVDVAVVYYGITEEDLAKIQNGLEIAREFWWRNSGLQLDLNLTYIPINEIVSPDSTSIGDFTIEKAINNAGYQISDFGGIFHISTDVDGTWSWGVHGNFDVGFSHSACVPCPDGCWIPTGVVYPGDNPSVNYGIIWIFTHEFQHAIDAMYDRSGYPEMFHGDQPEAYAVRGGEQFSYQAEGLRLFNNWLHLDYINKYGTKWGTVRQFLDNDGNGLPDNDSSLPIDDVRLGLGWDKEKYMAGIYQGSLTGNLYNIPSYIGEFSPVIDGDIESGWTLLTDKEIYDNIDISSEKFSAWDANNIYLAGTVDKPAKLHLWLDRDGDGWWNGKNNLEILFDISSNNVKEAHALDFSDEARLYRCSLPNSHMKDDGLCGGIWDDDPNYPFASIITPGDIESSIRLSMGVYSFEIRIPTTTFSETRETGYRIVFEYGGRATVFEDYELIYMRTSNLLPPCNSFGDVDLDGFVTESDAQLVMQHVVRMLTLSEEQQIRADVDGNEKVEEMDAMFIQQYIEGIRETFLVCEDTTPPTTPVVTDKGTFTPHTDQVYASWLSEDPDSGIAEYQYKITQDSPTGAIIRDWTSTGGNFVTAGGLSLINGTTYYFGVKAKNGVELWSEIGYSDGITVDTTLPTVTIASPENGATVANTGFDFTGTARDPSGIAEVRIYVYDYERSIWSVLNELASYDSDINTWVFQVQSTHITAGNQARPWVRAKDGADNWSSWQYIDVNVQSDETNQLPELDPIGNKTVNEGELLEFIVLATDPDGDSLTYSASNLPTGASFNPATQAFSWTPNFNQAGVYPGVQFEVTDGEFTDSKDITITVNAVSAKMHISQIDMSLSTSRGRTSARAQVVVVDKDGIVVPEATIQGHWSGLTNDSDSFITNASGVGTCYSNGVKKKVHGTFTFTVDNIAKSGCTYDPSANVETSDSIRK